MVGEKRFALRGGHWTFKETLNESKLRRDGVEDPMFGLMIGSVPNQLARVFTTHDHDPTRVSLSSSELYCRLHSTHLQKKAFCASKI